MKDFNQAEPQRSFHAIPAGTVATLQITVRPGHAGEDGNLKRSKDGTSEGLDLEFTVVGGEHNKRKFWTLFTLGGTTDGHAKAAQISDSKIRAILESGHAILPDDQSDAAKAARQIANYSELDGLRFIGRIGVQPAQNGYKAKNTLDEAITPDRVEWHAIEQAQAAKDSASTAKPSASASAPATAPATKIVKPTWAKG